MKSVTPIIMEGDMEVVGEKLGILRNKGVSKLHVDFGDALFSDLLTIAPSDLQQFPLEGLEMDFHLMVDDPTEWIEECVALAPKRIIGQIEHMGSQMAYLDSLKGYGITGGLGLKIDTPIESLEKEVLSTVGVVLLLAIPVGTTGSPFDIRVIEKIKTLRKVYGGSILIDGGMNPDTYKAVIEAGADEAGANSSYWSGEMN